MLALSPIVEIKRTLAGAETRFECRRLDGDDRHVVVLWIAPETMRVHGVELPAGTVSFGHFWIDRFYNVYHWVGGGQRTLGLYFNIADGTRIAPGELEWRDLVVDLLATPDGAVTVLDEEELPEQLEPEAAAHIAAGKAAILGAPGDRIAEIESISRGFYPLVFPRPEAT
jgi:Protein of unknown function (DUF402)